MLSVWFLLMIGEIYVSLDDKHNRDKQVDGKNKTLTVRGTQALVSFAPLAFKLFCAARHNAVLRRSPFPPV